MGPRVGDGAVARAPGRGMQQQPVGHGDLGGRICGGLAGEVGGGTRGEAELYDVLEFLQLVFHDIRFSKITYMELCRLHSLELYTLTNVLV